MAIYLFFNRLFNLLKLRHFTFVHKTNHLLGQLSPPLIRSSRSAAKRLVSYISTSSKKYDNNNGPKTSPRIPKSGNPMKTPIMEIRGCVFANRLLMIILKKLSIATNYEAILIYDKIHLTICISFLVNLLDASSFSKCMRAIKVITSYYYGIIIFSNFHFFSSQF